MDDQASVFVIGIECGHCREVTGLGWVANQPTKDFRWRCRSCGNVYRNNEELQEHSNHVILALKDEFQNE